MSLSRWSWRFLPAWTFFLGTLVGGFPGGLTRASNYPPLLLYVALTGAVWVPAELYARKREREQVAVDGATPTPGADAVTGMPGSGRQAL